MPVSANKQKKKNSEDKRLCAKGGNTGTWKYKSLDTISFIFLISPTNAHCMSSLPRPSQTQPLRIFVVSIFSVIMIYKRGQSKKKMTKKSMVLFLKTFKLFLFLANPFLNIKRVFCSFTSKDKLFFKVTSYFTQNKTKRKINSFSKLLPILPKTKQK